MLPAARGLDLVETFGKAIRGDLLAAKPALARHERVLAAHGDGIEPKPSRNFVDLLLAAELHLRLPEATKCAGSQLVRIGDDARGLCGLVAIRPARHSQTEGEHAGAIVRERAPIERRFDL